ncbi:MAG: NAD(+) diphosphatase [Blautia sp.]|jgi:NAD+ diphosphatase
MIQDIAPHIYHNEYQPQAPDLHSYLLVYENGEILLKKENDTLTLPQFRELEGKTEQLYENYVYLFSIDEDRFYLIPHLDPSLLAGYHFDNIRTLRTAGPQHLAFAGVTGYQLYLWYQRRQYCGICKTPMIHSKKERMMYCPECKNPEYPPLSPAVIVAITHGDKLLLSKYEGRNYKKYALIAGYAEIGETIEETVHREVLEEVGLKVKNLRYYKSQPWSFSGTLLFGFFCDLDGDDSITLDREELSMAEWFHRDDIPDEGEDISLTKEMMMAFKYGNEPL